MRLQPRGTAASIEARSNMAPGMMMDRMGHLKDSDFGELRSGRRGKSASISSF